MYTHVVVGQVAASAPHLANLRSPSGFNLNPGADRVAITGSPGQAKADPRAAIAAVIPVEVGRGIDIDREDIYIPVVVVVPESRAARGPRFCEVAGRAARGGLGEAAGIVSSFKGKKVYLIPDGSAIMPR